MEAPGPPPRGSLGLFAIAKVGQLYLLTLEVEGKPFGQKRSPLPVFLKSYLWYYLVWFSQVVFPFKCPRKEGEFQRNWDGRVSELQNFEKLLFGGGTNFSEFHVFVLGQGRGESPSARYKGLGILHFPCLKPLTLEQGPNPVSVSKDTLTTLNCTPQCGLCSTPGWGGCGEEENCCLHSPHPALLLSGFAALTSTHTGPHLHLSH